MTFRVLLLIAFLFVASFSVFIISPSDIATILTYYDTYSPQAPGLFMLILILLFALSVAIVIPIGVLLLMVFGYLYGFAIGAALAVFATLLGSMTMFLISRKHLEGVCRYLIGRAYDTLLEYAKNQPLSYLLSSRFTPLVPFPIVHVIPAHAGVPLVKYLLVTLIGTLPAVLVFVYIGSMFRLTGMLNQSLVETASTGLLLVSLLVLATVLLRHHLKKKNLYVSIHEHHLKSEHARKQQ